MLVATWLFDHCGGFKHYSGLAVRTVAEIALDTVASFEIIEWSVDLRSEIWGNGLDIVEGFVLEKIL